jgi:predicted RNA methylase
VIDAPTPSMMDRSFDLLIPPKLRHLSSSHWTPVELAIRVTALLAPAKHARVLDVGAGIGKLCTVGALASQALWCGVERHEPFVEIARRLASRFHVASRTMFVHGDALAIDWHDFDAVYLYNPFEAPMFGAEHPDEAEADRCARAQKQIAQAELKLSELRAGTRVVTLHGFGGRVPPTFELLYQERELVSGLELVMWSQRSGMGRRRS